MARVKRNYLWPFLSGVVILAILAALLDAVPSASRQMPANAAPILAVINYPADGSRWPADNPIPVGVMVIGKSALQKVELWVDGRLFDSQASGKPYFYRAWRWMPFTPGEHTLFARATGADGRTADSNVLHIQASPAAGFLAVATSKQGDTLQSLAQQNGLPLTQLAASNPALDPQAPLPAGQQIFLPFQYLPSGGNGTPSKATPGPAPANPANPGGPAALPFLVKSALHVTSSLPAAPSLQAAVGVCNVTLTIQDSSQDEDGFFVYALTDSAASFDRITSLKAYTGTLQYVVPNQHGQVQFYVSAYNTFGEAPSAPVQVDISSPQCNPTPAETGGLKYSGGILSLPKGTQLAYLYASINGGTYQRLPPGHAFMRPSSGQVDLRSQIQQLLGGAATGEADLDVWGWKDGALVHLGQLHININFASLAICDLGLDCNGDMGSTHWVTQATVGSDQANPTRAFRWSAQGLDITYAIWQIGSQPFPLQYSIGAPPGLLASGISQADVDPVSGAAGGIFNVDFATDLQAAAAPSFNHLAGFHLPGQSSNNFDTSLLPSLGVQWNSQLASAILQVALSSTFYIRVMPMAGGHPSTDPSNTVVVTYRPTGPVPTVQIYKVPSFSVQVVPGSYTNQVMSSPMLGVLGCSIITGADHDTFVTWFKDNLAAQPFFSNFNDEQQSTIADSAFQVWNSHIGDKICPAATAESDTPWYDQFWEDLGDAVSDLFNSLSSALDTIKGTLVDALASIIPGCGPSCSDLLMTGLNFTITYFTGLPPNIPSYNDMVNLGISYAVQTAIDQSGIPYCDETCQGKITSEIQSISQQVAASGGSQPACGASMWATDGSTVYDLQSLCIPPGISYSPVPGSMYQPATLQVKVSRIDGSPQTVPAEQLVIDSQALNPAFADGHTENDSYMINTLNCTTYFYIYRECTPNDNSTYYTVVYNMPLKGTPFPTKTIPVPALKAFQSIVIPVVFDSSSYNYTWPNVYPPRAIAILKANPSADLSTVPVDWWRDFLHLTDSGSQITISAKVLCQDQSTPNTWNSPCSDVNAAQFVAP